MTFLDKLRVAQARTQSYVCVGLDPVPERLPEPLRTLPTPEAVLTFCKVIVDATYEVACAFKPNLAFFEALGSEGLRVLEQVVAHIPADRIILADAKRGDIGNTARMYARAFFESMPCDACTVTPYMGRDAVLPFLAYPGRAVFVLTRTSNPSAADFQDLQTAGRTLYQHVAHQVTEWATNEPGTAGFVVGATDIETLAQMRTTFPKVPFLIPGIGTQGGDPSAVIQASATGPVLINSSRGILYADAGPNFAEAAHQAADTLRKTLNVHCTSHPSDALRAGRRT